MSASTRSSRPRPRSAPRRTAPRGRARSRARPAPRTAARRRPARRAPGRVNWDRLGRRVLVLVLFAVLLSYVGPILSLVEDWRDARAEQERFVDLQRENARLHERAETLESPAAAEEEARRLGMVAPGERAYVIRGLAN